MDFGLFLPCKVTVYKTETGTKVSVLKVSKMDREHLGGNGNTAEKYENELIEVLKGIQKNWSWICLDCKAGNKVGSWRGCRRFHRNWTYQFYWLLTKYSTTFIYSSFQETDIFTQIIEKITNLGSYLSSDNNLWKNHVISNWIWGRNDGIRHNSYLIVQLNGPNLPSRFSVEFII